MNTLNDKYIQDTLANLLGDEVNQKIERTVEVLNKTIRDKIRDATGLKLSFGDSSERIIIRVVPDLPRSFVTELEGIDHDLLSWLVRHSTDLQAAFQTMQEIRERYGTIEAALAPHRPAAVQNDITRVSTLIRQLIDWKKRFRWPEILEPAEPTWTGREPFGTYSPHEGVVKIHWIAIGMFVALCDDYPYSVEDLTAVVLAHELAHAYTHRGFDTDGLQWEPRRIRGSAALHAGRFLGTDIFILEGLAQYYTKIVCERMQNTRPAMIDAFEDLLSFQALCYNDFESWVPGSPHRSEIVRLVMIETRARGIREYDKFNAELEKFASDWTGSMQTTIPDGERWDLGGPRRS